MIEYKDIVFDDDINISDEEDKIDGYLWATEKLCELINYKGDINCDEYVNFYAIYDFGKDEWKVESIEHIWENEEYITRKTTLDLGQNELDIIAEKFIDAYFGTKENFNDFIENLKGERY